MKNSISIEFWRLKVYEGVFLGAKVLTSHFHPLVLYWLARGKSHFENMLIGFAMEILLEVFVQYGPCKV